MGEGARPGGDYAAADPATGRRMAVPEAAEALGITADAVRSRIKRGTLTTEHEGVRVFVVMGSAARPTDRAQPTNRPGGQAHDLQDQVQYLREQLRREQEAHAEARKIIAGLVHRIPELPAPETPPGPPERGGATQDKGVVPTEGQTATSRPWWRRVFGS